jgi:peptide alpha-N-acetyltransferase
MLRMQERLYSHKFYRRAAKDSIRIYMELYDQKLKGEGEAAEAEDDNNKEAEMSAAEKKKLKHKKKRETKKDEEKTGKTTTTTSGKPKKVDDDPDGEKLLEKDPMEEASKLVKQLVLYCGMDAATHVLTYDVFQRQGKLLHCLQALIRLWQLSGGDKLSYKLVASLTHFCFVAKLEDEAMPSAVREVILSELAPILGAEGPFESVAALRTAATQVVDAVEQRIKTNPELSLIEVLYGLKCLKHAGRDCRTFLESWRPEGAFALKECNKLLSYLASEYGKDSSVWERFKQRCLEIFPLMVIS